MNRNERRAALKRGKGLRTSPMAGAPSIVELISIAGLHYRQGRFAEAEAVCRQILARDPAQAECLNLLGLIAQAGKQHDRAVRFFVKAIESDGGNTACHFNIALSYQALEQWDKATAHFTRAIALGVDDNSVLQFVTHTPVIAGCLLRLADAWPRRLTSDELFGDAGVAAITNQVLLHCMLKSTWVCNWGFENFLTHVRYFLLQLAAKGEPHFSDMGEMELRLFCALAQQCFTNEYVFDQLEGETRQATALRELLNEKLAAKSEIPAPLIAAVAAYFPLHALPTAETLLRPVWPSSIGELIRQQIGEPLEERKDRQFIPALTAIDDSVSLQVRQQYEENPFPRSLVIKPAKKPASHLPGGPLAPNGSETGEILIAGCGTGTHSIETALKFPQARVLAIDLSLSSLAYARRKTREAGVKNIEYAQADILRLGELNRTFDRIESVGVLHHLADPLAGWRVLLSLLRPGGVMFVGLYSEIARRAIVAGRAMIKQKGYPSTVEGIRACRQEIYRGTDATLQKGITTLRDFYSTRGCRDLLFNVMEHRFTLPQIKAFLTDHGLSFLGFDIDLHAFARQFPDPAAPTDLDLWHAFEAENPETFIGMYRFLIRKNR